MGTRSLAQVAPTPSIIALNANIFGYAGHSLVTPHVAIKQSWWTEENITARVTRSFVLSKLRGEERDFLDRPLAFGDGLTDDTYMEWILGKAKRLFLILTEIGVPDQIFGCIDDSWGDDDLPLSLDCIPDLELAIENNDALNKKFYDTQFVYLLRELQPGSHIDYGPREHIPMEYVNTVPPAVHLQVWDRVHFPGKPEEVFMRRKFLLTDKDTCKDYRETFRRDVEKAQKLPHEHIAPVWASYTADNAAYVVSDFVGEHTLGTFIDHRMPTQLQRVPPSERPGLLLGWLHCLAETLACLHHRGSAHEAIWPSNILISRENRIAFADVGNLKTFQRGKKTNKTEIYDYAAPESLASSTARLVSSPPVSSMGAFNRLRKMSSSTSSSSGSSSTRSSTRTNSVCTTATNPAPGSPERVPSMTTITTSISPSQISSRAFRNFSRHIDNSFRTSLDTPTSPTNTVLNFPKPTIPDPGSLRDLPKASAKMSDVYSLACIFLDIVTFLLKGKNNDFVKFRTTRITSSNSSSKRSRNDTSFHADPEKIYAWIAILKEDSERRSEQVYRGLPEALRLIQRMLLQNATLRPTALEVCDQLQKILVDLCGLERLCCANRDWNVPLLPTTPNSSLRNGVREAMSTAAAISAARPSGAVDEEAVDTIAHWGDAGALPRLESNAASPAPSRGQPSNRSGTARKTSWRKAFSLAS